MPVEPPGPDVPADAREASEAFGPLRLTAAVVAIVVVAVARGPLVVLPILLAVVVANVAGIVAVALAFVATASRWGTRWLVAVGGAQAVLGPAGAVGPPSAAASTWLAAAALVLVVPCRSVVAAVALGSAAAFLVAGPAGLDGIAMRIAATLVLSLLAVGVAQLRWRAPRTLAAVVLAGAAALLA